MPADLRALRDAVVEARAEAEPREGEELYTSALKRGFRNANISRAERALADAISPEVVEAWETLMRLGKARAELRCVDENDVTDDGLRMALSDDVWACREALDALADRLAEKGGSK